MADRDGTVVESYGSNASGTKDGSRPVVEKSIGSGGDIPIQYRMRAWNTNTVDWEFWESTGAPDLSPPSGDPVNEITILWSAVL